VSVPFFLRRIADSTRLEADFPYSAMDTSDALPCKPCAGKMFTGHDVPGLTMASRFRHATRRREYLRTALNGRGIPP
jgi:hypothetical protein